MMSFRLKSTGIAILALIFLTSSGAWGEELGVTPEMAFDTTSSQYLMVWVENTSDTESQVVGKLLNRDGSDMDGTIHILSPERPTQGCFYQNFDAQNGDLTAPSNCPENLNPTVSFNDGKYLIAWEVHGIASSPTSSPANRFKNIFAKLIDASTLNPLEGWGEGVLISKTYIAANNAESCGNGKFACKDSEIQAWSQSVNPHAAPNIGSSGFVVTWQSNKDFIGCANADRRQGLAVYGRYIDENFSATSSSNPAMFAIFKDDSTMEDTCATLSNVDNGSNARIAFNPSSNDFVVAYELARADGGRATIAAKRLVIDESGLGAVGGSMMPGIVASLDSGSLTRPDIIPFKDQFILVASDGSEIYSKVFSSDSIENSTPTVLNIEGDSKSSPRVCSNLGVAGQGSPSDGAPERILVTYQQNSDILSGLFDSDLESVGDSVNLSDGLASSNLNGGLDTDGSDFVIVWQGDSGGMNVFHRYVDTETGLSPMPSPSPTPSPTSVPMGDPPTAPAPLAPSNGATFAPTRAYLSWSASSDPDGDDSSITYNIYFGETTLPGTPQITGITDANYVIGPETQGVTGITPQANRVYKWAIEAVDEEEYLGFSPHPKHVFGRSMVSHSLAFLFPTFQALESVLVRRLLNPPLLLKSFQSYHLIHCLAPVLEKKALAEIPEQSCLE